VGSDQDEPTVDTGCVPLSLVRLQVADIVRRHWDFAGSVDVVPIDAGLNNPTFRVRAGGRCYAARLYRNLDVLSIRREHALLGVLVGADLPFAVPAPAPCRDGSTFAETPQGCLALFDWIEGEHADPDDLRHLRVMGTALAELDETLLRLDARLTRLPGDLAPRHGQLDRIHPAVPDAGVLARRLADDRRLQDVASEISWFGAAIAVCLETVPRLYAALPRQWIHQDLALSNALQMDGRITGVLDFEFADQDLRVLDLVAMLTNSISGFEDESGWQRTEAFCRGYCARVRLTEQEVDAVPDLIRLRYVVANIHGVGRWLAGLNPTEEVLRRLRHGAGCDRLIQRDAERMRAIVHAATR